MSNSRTFMCAALAMLAVSSAGHKAHARTDGPKAKSQVVVVRGGKIARDDFVRRQLKTTVVIHFNNTPLKTALSALAQAAHVNLFVEGGLSGATANIQPLPVTLRFRYPVSVAVALHLILVGRGLTYTARHGVLVVGSPDSLADLTVIRCYRLEPLMMASTRRHPALINRLQEIKILKLLQNTIDRQAWVDNGGTVNIARILDGTLVITAGERDQWRIERILAALADQVRRHNRRVTRR